MSKLSPPEELAGATAFRDALRRFNERLSQPDDSLRAPDAERAALRELERDIEAKRTRHLLAAWKLREARQAFEAAQKEASHTLGQYRVLQNDVASRMEEIARECGEEPVVMADDVLPWALPEPAPTAKGAPTVSGAPRTKWMRQAL